ncbi:DUF4132 domain-containing protein [Kitasatospora sp. NPDC002227]|uniref:DUF4132 domain-containing protein n=1 Tax=Kitasatospora sp. NPDC002227 TaxID=3154773 RepID=UPI00331D9C9B
MTTTTTEELDAAVAELLDVLDSGRLGSVCMALEAVDIAVAGDWSAEGVLAARERVLALHPRSRAEVVADCVRGLLSIWRPGPETDAQRQARASMIRLASLVSQGWPDGPAREQREDWLHLLGRQWTLMEGDRAVELIRAEQAAGRPVDAAVVATVRRTAIAIRPPQQGTATELAAELDQPPLSPGEAWADQVLADLAEEARGGGRAWAELVGHARELKSAKPTARWEKAGQALLAAVGPEAARERITAWLALVGRPRTLELVAEPHEEGLGQFDPYNLDALRGLALLLALTPARPESARVLGRLVVSALRKAPGIGPRAPKVANAAVAALARLDGTDGLAQLALLSTGVTYKGTVKELDKALRERAGALGVGQAELEELAVPGYGLDGLGACVRPFGEARVELLVEGVRVRQGWYNESGRQVKAAPASVRREHAEEFKEFKASVQEIEKMLAAQSDRLERQYLARRSWVYGPWRERLLDHPLVGTLARRLVWVVGGTAYAWLGGALRDAQGAEPGFTGDEPVELWHPVDHPAEAVSAWQELLARHGVDQPFAQVHRQVYRPTGAKGAHCDRFAGRSVSQYRFNSAATDRGWHTQVQLLVDNSFAGPRRLLPEWGLRAEFWVTGTDADWGEAFTALTTGEVRFYPITAPENRTQAGSGEYGPVLVPGLELVEPVPLVEVPALVLSEVLYELDLCVRAAGPE